MALNAQVTWSFANGTTLAGYNNALNDGATTEIQTGGTNLNQTSGISLGQAAQDQILTHCGVVVNADGVSTTCFMAWYILDPQGKIVLTGNGGGNLTGGAYEPVIKPLKLTTGHKFYVIADTRADGDTQYAAMSCYFTDGSCDLFIDAATAGAGAEGSMVSYVGGSTFGQAAAGKVLAAAIPTYSAQFGANDDGAGNSGWYHEDSQGQLKSIWFPYVASGQGETRWQFFSVPVDQNDTLTCAPDS